MLGCPALMPTGGQPEEELKALLPASIAVRFEEMFPDVRPGRINRRDRKRAEMLRKAEPVLTRDLVYEVSERMDAIIWRRCSSRSQWRTMEQSILR